MIGWTVHESLKNSWKIEMAISIFVILQILLECLLFLIVYQPLNFISILQTYFRFRKPKHFKSCSNEEGGIISRIRQLSSFSLALLCTKGYVIS